MDPKCGIINISYNYNSKIIIVSTHWNFFAQSAEYAIKSIYDDCGLP